jgi:hypothetical protein
LKDVGEIERLAGVGGGGGEVLGAGVGVGVGAGTGTDFLHFFFDATAERFFLHFFFAAYATSCPGAAAPVWAVAAAISATQSAVVESCPSGRPFIALSVRTGTHQTLIAPRAGRVSLGLPGGPDAR